jgi:hypothetical protein
MSLPSGIADEQRRLNQSYPVQAPESEPLERLRAELNRDHLLGALPALSPPAGGGPLRGLVARLKRSIEAAVRELVQPKLERQEAVNARAVALFNDLAERLEALARSQREVNGRVVRLLNFLIEREDQGSEQLQRLRYKAVELERRLDEVAALHHESVVLAEKLAALDARLGPADSR